MKLNPYLHFNGNCKDAFDYYVKHLGAKVVMSMTYAEAPELPQGPCSPEAKEKIMHARLDLAGNILMGSDVPKDYYQKPHGISVSINLTEEKEAERIYAALRRKPRSACRWARPFGRIALPC